jgi:hypothetical protein
MVVFSTNLGMAIETSQRLDSNFCSIASKREIHPYDEKDDCFVREMLIDDEGDRSQFKDKYASVVIPTWDNRLIAFPKPR